MTKKMVSIFLVIVTFALLICSSISVSADNVARSLYTSNVTSELTISGTTATCKSSVEGKNGATKTEISQYLQKRTSSGDWNTIYSNSGTYNNANKNTLTGSKSGLGKGTYRLKTISKVYSGGKYETTTKYSSNKTV